MNHHIEKEFRMKKFIERVEKDWVNPYFHKDNPVKVFYHFNEWNGWRFYLKALRNKDWKSLIGHIKSNF